MLPSSTKLLLLHLHLLHLLRLVPPSLSGSQISLQSFNPQDVAAMDKQITLHPNAQGIYVYFRNGLRMQIGHDRLEIRAVGGFDNELAGTSSVTRQQHLPFTTPIRLVLELPPDNESTEQLLKEAAHYTGQLATKNAATYGSSGNNRQYMLTRTDTRETYILGSEIIGSGEGFAGKFVVLDIRDTKIIRHCVSTSSADATSTTNKGRKKLFRNRQQGPVTQEFSITWKKNG